MAKKLATNARIFTKGVDVAIVRLLILVDRRVRKTFVPIRASVAKRN
ncbi:hypothetical protein [Pleomorphovibrio marinus]|nr:hypothetical protein [Pleomorphovibrio marinus]